MSDDKIMDIADFELAVSCTVSIMRACQGRSVQIPLMIAGMLVANVQDASGTPREQVLADVSTHADACTTRVGLQ